MRDPDELGDMLPSRDESWAGLRRGDGHCARAMPRSCP
jgi:hypothetical protein